MNSSKDIYKEYIPPKGQPWSAHRCGQLISPLISRVRFLKDDATRYILTDASDLQNELLAKPFDTEDEECPARANRKTYSLKCRHKRQHIRTTRELQSAISQHNVLSEPSHSDPAVVIAAASPTRPHEQLVGADVESDVAPESPSSYKLRRTLRIYTGVMRPAQKDLVEGLYCSFRALLRSTQEPVIQHSRPRPSLFSACLRAVPGRIELEEKWESESAGSQARPKSAMEQRDISSEVYTELERSTFGGRNREHLRVVVRAHGTAIVADAIKDGLVSSEIAGAMVEMCIQLKAPAEAEVLLLSLLLRMPKLELDDQPACWSKTLELSSLVILENFLEKPLYTSAYFRILLGGFQSGRLSVQWLATKHFQRMWRFLADMPKTVCPDTVKFLHAIILLLAEAVATYSLHVAGADYHHKRLYNLWAYQVSKVACMMHHNELGKTRWYGVNPDFALRLWTVQLFKLAGSSSHPQHLYGMLIANFCARLPDDAATSFAARILSQLENEIAKDPHSITTRFVEFLKQFKNASGTQSSADRYSFQRQLKNMCSFVESSLASQLYKTTRVLRKVLVDSAYHLAEVEPIPENFEFAQALAEKYQSRMGSTPRARPSIQPLSTRRWEHGIEEWVPVTPAASDSVLRESQSSVHFGQPHESPDSPLRQFPARAVKRKRVAQCAESRARLADLVPESPDPLGDLYEDKPVRYSVASMEEPALCIPKKRLIADMAPPPKMQRLDSGNNDSLQADPTLPQNIRDKPIQGSLKLDKPFQFNFNDNDTVVASKNCHHEVESSGDELGY